MNNISNNHHTLHRINSYISYNTIIILSKCLIITPFRCVTDFVTDVFLKKPHPLRVTKLKTEQF